MFFIVLRRVLETVERGADLIVDIAVTRGELVAGEEVDQGEIDGIDPVGIGGVHFRADVGGVVRDDIVDVAAFVVVGTDYLRVRRDVVDHQIIRDDALPEAEVLRGMPGVDGSDPRFILLAVAARMELAADVVLPEDLSCKWGQAGELRQSRQKKPAIGRKGLAYLVTRVCGASERGAATSPSE